MSSTPSTRSVRTENEIRLTLPASDAAIAPVLQTLARSGNAVLAHLVYRTDAHTVALLVCERPTEAALALSRAGFTLDVRTVVLARAEHRPGALAHLITTLEADRIRIDRAYAASSSEGLLAVFATGDNPKAEDILRTYLLQPDPRPPDTLPPPPPVDF